MNDLGDPGVRERKICTLGQMQGKMRWVTQPQWQVMGFQEQSEDSI